MIKAIVVGVALAVSIAVLVWSPKVAVVEVDVYGEGLDRRLVIPESRGTEGKDGKNWEFVKPKQTIIHPRKAHVVIAHVGRVIAGSNGEVRIPGETRTITIRIDWTRVFAEWALIFSCAAFVLVMMNFTNEDPAQTSALQSSSPNKPLQPTGATEAGAGMASEQGAING